MTKKEMHRTAYSWACELYANDMPYEHIVAELQDLFPADVAQLAAELAEPPLTEDEVDILIASGSLPTLALASGWPMPRKPTRAVTVEAIAALLDNDPGAIKTMESHAMRLFKLQASARGVLGRLECFALDGLGMDERLAA